MERINLPSMLAGSVSMLTLMSYIRRTSIATRSRPRTARLATLCRSRVVQDSEIAISDEFDSGNVRVVDATNPQDIRLEIREEPMTEGTDKRRHFQWFYFRASNVKGVSCRYRLTNAAKASFPEAWEGYKVAYSYAPSAENPQWLRVQETSYVPPSEGKATEPELTWTFRSENDSVWFAYFAPFSYERHQALIAYAMASPLAETSVIGYTLAGRPMDLIKIGNGHRKVWVIARQHPGESMAEWWMKGFITRLLLSNDAVSKNLREGATVYIVPNMNPDGSAMGHLRTNKGGANLNREWQSGVYEGYDAPTLERSPEVFCVLEKMKKTGVDLFIDVHGDEQIPDNFFAGSQGIPKWSKRQEDLYILLNYAVLCATNEFQVGRGYGDPDDKDFKCVNSPPGEANLSVASNHVGNRFDCCAATLEMPFKDTTKTAEAKKGWSPERAQAFGGSMVSSFATMLPHLRGEINAEGKKMLAEARAFTGAAGTDWFTENNK